MEDGLRERRQERQNREPEERRRRREDDERDEAALVPHVMQSALELLFHLLRDRRRHVLHVQQRQRVDDDEERGRVEEERRVHRLGLVVAALDEDGQRGGEEQRTEHAREVELDGVERDGVRQILLVDEHRQQRLVRRAAERLRDAGDERQREDVPDLHDVQVHQQGERAGRRHLDVLRHHQRLAFVVAIGEDAADEREQDDRQLLQERVEAQVEGRVRQ